MALRAARLDALVHTLCSQVRFRLPSASVVVGTLLLASLAGVVAACERSPGPTSEPLDATPAVTSILGRCGQPLEIEPVPPVADDEWRAAELRPASPPCFRLRAEPAAGRDVATDATFVFESAVELTPDQVREQLVADPRMVLDVLPSVAGIGEARGSLEAHVHDASPSGDGLSRILRRGSWIGLGAAVAQAQGALAFQYGIVPSVPLPEGEVVRFAMLNAQDGRALDEWAFQVEAPLRVISTLPRDHATDVPAHTGIELTFSHDGVVGVEDRLTVEPDVAGSFETHKRTVVFVPEAELLPATLYTVRLEPGAGVEGEDAQLAEAFEFRFETGRDFDPSRIASPLFERHVWEHPTDEAPALSLQWTDVPSMRAKHEADIRVYAYHDAIAFMAALDAFSAVPDWSWFARTNYRAETEGLPVVAEFSAVLSSLNTYGSKVLQFPDALDGGFYLVSAEMDGSHAETFLQVTDLAAYASVSLTKTLVWVNDVSTGGPARAARVTGAGLDELTDGDGMILIDTPSVLAAEEETRWGTLEYTIGNLLVADDTGRQTVVPLADLYRGYRSHSFRDWGGQFKGNLYWRYLYTDRKLYRPTDELRFWGVARTREGGPSIDTVDVSVTGSGSVLGSAYGNRVAHTSAVLSESGTFTGALQIEGASPGWYTLRVHAGDVEISATGVEVKDFVKPAYRLDVRPARRAVLAGEPVTMTAAATFFEGSPVPNVALRANGDYDERITTDSRGEATLTYPAPVWGERAYLHSSVHVTPYRAEEGQIEATGTVIVVPAEVALDVNARLAGTTANVSGTVHGVDLALVNDDPDRDPTAFRAGLLAGRPVTAEVTETRYEPTQTGTTYDYVNKRTRPVYRYDRVETLLGTFDTSSADDGSFRFEFPTEEERSYTIVVGAMDDVGRATAHALHLGAPQRPRNYPTAGLQPNTLGPYEIGDDVHLQLVSRSGDLSQGDRYLFYEAQNGIRTTALVDVPEYGFTFDESRVPNVRVVGVWFGGRTFEETMWAYNAAFDPSSKNLDITLASEHARYAPGDDVTLDVTVRDATGRPASGRVLLSAVDAAVEAMQYDSARGDQFLSTLYASVGSGVVTTYASHQVPRSVPSVEGGGGGGERDDFRDTALFEEVATDESGHATVTFGLPDNLTSWSITALGVTDDLRAGSGRGSVPVGLPFFVDVTMNETYLEADHPEIRLRAYGDGLSEGDPVSFKLVVEATEGETTQATPDDGAAQAAANDTGDPVAVDGLAFESTNVPLPSLREGRYRVRVAGQSGHLEDALARPLLVKRSHLVATTADFVELSTGDDFTPPDGLHGPVTIALSDANRGRYHRELRSLATTHGDRADQVLARQLAADMLVQYFGDPVVAEASSIVPYRVPAGGLALLPYGDVDLTTSVLAAAVAPDTVGRQGMRSYLASVVLDAEETAEREAAALWGLASLGQSVLGDVSGRLAAGAGTPVERLYLGLAAADAGDRTLAASVYQSVTAEYAEQRGPNARLAVGGDHDDVLVATALGAVLGASVADGLSPAMYGYVAANSAHDTLLVLQQAAYLQRALPRLSSLPGKVAYSLAGQREERTIAGANHTTLFLSPSALDQLNLTVLEGTIGVSTARDVPIDANVLATDPAVSITRTFTAMSPLGGALPATDRESTDEGVQTFRDGDLVRVVLDYELQDGAVDGCYQLSDLLPSGLRANTSVSDPMYEGPEDNRRYPYAIEGQRVSFCVYSGDRSSKVVYYARVLGNGTFVAEPALIQSMVAPESLGLSARNDVVIR